MKYILIKIALLSIMFFYSGCQTTTATKEGNSSNTEKTVPEITQKEPTSNVVMSDFPKQTVKDVNDTKISNDFNLSDENLTNQVNLTNEFNLTIEDFNVSFDEGKLLSIGEGNISIVLNKNIKEEIPTGDIEGVLLVSGANQEIAGSIFVTPIFNHALSAKDVLDGYRQVLSNRLQHSSGVNFVSVSTQNNPSNDVILSSITSYYDINLPSTAQPVELLNEVVSLIASNVENGEVNSSLIPLESSIAVDKYRLGITVQYMNNSKVLTRFAFVDENSSIQYADRISDIINPNNVKVPGLITETVKETFTARDTNGSNSADFLFVIDNSGSMSSYQNSVRQAASDFASTLSLSNLDYHIGIITTDRSYLVNSSFIDNNITQFENNIVVGTSGSGTETGIYEAEQALQSTLYGDSEDGSVTLLGYPRFNAHLNIIILSDERSQYTSRAYGEFDPYNNLFLDRNYTVYAIVNQDDDGQYVDLADATGGTSASINASEYSGLMQNIAFNSGSIARGYKLSHPATIKTVSIDGVNVPRSSENGWSYNSSVNALLFDGNYTPNAGSEIAVEYTYTRAANITSIALSIAAGSEFYTGDMIHIKALEGFEDGNTRVVEVNPTELNVTSSNSTIVSVLDDKIVAMGKGNASITVKSDSNVTSIITINTQGYRTVEFGKMISGTTLANREIYYKVDVNGYGILSRDLELDGSSYVYTYLYDENFTQLDSSSNYYHINSMNELTKGTYYIGVKSSAQSSYDMNVTFNKILSSSITTESNKTYYPRDNFTLNLERLLEDGNTNTLSVSPYNYSIASSDTSVINVNYSSLQIQGSGETNISITLPSGEIITKEVVVNENPLLNVNGVTQGKNAVASQTIYYKFDINQTSLFNVNIASQNYFYAYIYNANFNSLSSNSGYDFNISKILENGTYYVGIQSSYGLKNYTLTSTLSKLLSINLNVESNITLKDSVEYNITRNFANGKSDVIPFDRYSATLSETNNSVLSIDYYGTITAQAVGESNLSVSMYGFSDTAHVIVNDTPSVALNQNLTTQNVDSSKTHYYKVDVNSTGLLNLHTNSNNYIYTYIYDENFNSIAYTYGRDFNVSEVISAGKYYIGVGNYNSATYDLNVTFKKLQAIKLNTENNVSFGSVIDLNMTRVYDDNSSDTIIVTPSDYNITSSNSTIVKVNNNIVSTQASGEANVTITAYDGMRSTVKVRVNEPQRVNLNSVLQNESVSTNSKNYYSFDLNQTMGVTLSSISNYDTYGYLYDENMTMIAGDDDGGTGSNFMITKTLNTGKYYIAVKGYNGRNVDSYDLNISAQ